MKKLFTLLLLLSVSGIMAMELQIPWTIQSFRGNDGELYFATTFKIPEGQSLYWHHPGIAGSAPQVEISIDQQLVELEEINWEKPKRKVLSKDLHSYLVKNQLTLFHRVPGEIADRFYDRQLTIKAKWLTCAEVCLQGSESKLAHFIHDQLNLKEIPPFALPVEQLKEQLASRPIKVEIPATLDLMLGKDQEGKYLFFYSTQEKFDPLYQRENLLYPYHNANLIYSAEKLYQDRQGLLYGKMTIQGTITFPFTVELFFNSINGPVLISKTFQSASTDLSSTLSSLESILREVMVETESDSEKQTTSKSHEPSSFWYFILMAFLGGLILNVMPCVLPVLSLKLFGLIKISGASRREILTHNLFYTLGILLTFAVLAMIVIFVKSTGEAIGWGFQMQSPSFLAFMIVALVIFALNLFGVFEFRTPGGSFLGNIKVTHQHLGSFLSGILAVILSTPCSAPFLGTALTFAFTTTNSQLLALMMAIGLGLAFPIILTGVFPRLINFFPRPGEWMNKLKKFLGLSLALTALWLASIFYTITLGDKFQMMTDQWHPWSESFLAQQVNQNMVFIRLTADWCITCKVDEKLILSSQDFNQLLEQSKMIKVVGDFTSPTPELDQWMKKHGIISVPSYIIQMKDGRMKVIEGQLTLGKLKEIIQTQI